MIKRAQITDILKALAHPLRLRIAWILTQSPRKVMEICSILGVPQAIVSQQLKILKQIGAIDCTRIKKSVSYEIADKDVSNIVNLVWKRYVAELLEQASIADGQNPEGLDSRNSSASGMGSDAFEAAPTDATNAENSVFDTAARVNFAPTKDAAFLNFLKANNGLFVDDDQAAREVGAGSSPRPVRGSLAERKTVRVLPNLCSQDHMCLPIDFCPQKAISQNGFDLPEVNALLCDGCGRCVRVCPLNALELT